MQGMTVPVADILGRPGEYRDITVAGRLEGVTATLARLTDEPIRAPVRLESVVEGILVTGKVHGETVITCARCLKEVPSGVDVELCELFTAPGHAPEGKQEDSYAVSGTEVDLEPMLRDAVALALPLKPLCKEDCLGLCSACGRELSGEACDCVQEETDPRWAALDSLRARLEA